MVVHSSAGSLPFRQFIVKLHSRCNLTCDYCYVYTMADQRWRARPRVMSRTIVEHTADRIAEHVRAHGQREVEIVVHGGEPLLAGRDALAHLASVMHVRIPAQVRIVVQTNGTLLDSDLLELFLAWDVRVSVSLDGDAAAHDRHRTGPADGSYHRVAAGLRRLGAERFRHLFGGLLCVVDLDNDPLSTYHALLDFAPPRIDFLLPHGNWPNPPPARILGSADTPYADWLITIFDRWYGMAGYGTGIRLFEEIMSGLLGGRSRVEGIGMSPTLAIVVETDGSIERSDILSALTVEGAAQTGLHVERDPFDAALALPDVLARPISVLDLPAICQNCRIHRVCGGGLRAHRYDEEMGIDRPSVYCPDLYRLIGHIRARMRRDLMVMR